jgi:peptide chain release factor subunit 1
MHDLLRRLSEVQPSDVPVLSIYLDMRPQATGESPAKRTGEIALKDRLREIEKTLGPRGEDLDSFRADAERISQYLTGEASPAAQGIAIFASHGQNLFETFEAGVAFENQVSIGPTPDLFQLARLIDDHETTVVAVVDSNTARLFVTRSGFFDEVGGPNDSSEDYRKRQTGGWSQMRFQRHVEKHRTEFAREIAEAIDDLVARENATRVVLSGDEVTVPRLRDLLSPRVANLVEDVVPRIHIRANSNDVRDEIAPILAELEADKSRSVADRLVGAVRANGLGVAGLESTRTALEAGQVDVVLISARAELDEETRSDLVRLAANTSADVEVVEEHDAFEQLGGVGALLRYRTDQSAVPAA